MKKDGSEDEDQLPLAFTAANCSWLHSSSIQKRQLSSFSVPGKSEADEMGDRDILLPRIVISLSV